MNIGPFNRSWNLKKITCKFLGLCDCLGYDKNMQDLQSLGPGKHAKVCDEHRLC